MVFVKLQISGHHLDFGEISDTFKIPTAHISTFKEGNTFISKHTKETILYAEDRWIAEIGIKDFNEAEKRILELISFIYAKKDFVQQLSSECALLLWITIYNDDCQYNLRFSKETLRMIGELGLEVSISCMQLQEFYSGK